MSKIAFFDFCGTLVSFQTADAYVDYVRNKCGSRYMRILDVFLKLSCRLKVILVFNKLFPGNSWHKRMKLYQLRNLSSETLERYAESFYREMIKPDLIQPVVEEMKSLSEDGYELCLVSAAYSIYLRYFTTEFNIIHILSTEIKFDKTGQQCLGQINGTDCYGDEKVRRIRDYFSGITQYNDSISYSDSISDLPMLRFAKRAVVVSRGKSQTWFNENNFREIIWK